MNQSNAFVDEQTRYYLPILERQMGHEVTTRRKWHVVTYVLCGLHPDTKRALIRHIRNTQKDVFTYAFSQATSAAGTMHGENVIEVHNEIA